MLDHLVGLYCDALCRVVPRCVSLCCHSAAFCAVAVSPLRNDIGQQLLSISRDPIVTPPKSGFV